MISHDYCATIHWFRREAAEMFESQRTAPPLPGHRAGAALGGPYRPRLKHLCHGLRASGDRTDAKGAERVLSLTGRDEVKAHVGRELGASDWQPVGRENLDASAQAMSEEQFGHLDVGCCPRTTA
jgi:hypothetical protein